MFKLVAIDIDGALTCFWQGISHLLQVGDELPGIDSYDFIRHTIISIK